MKKIFWPSLALLLLLVALWTSLTLTPKRQETRKEAVAPIPAGGKITLSPQTVSKYPGERFSVVINFQTGPSETEARVISSLTLRMTYPYSGTTPELEIVDPAGNSSNQIYPETNLISSGDWAFPIKTVSRSEGMVTIDLAAINTSILGFKSSQETPLATIYFWASRVPSTNPIILSFNLSYSQMMTKSDPPEDILETPVNGSYTIQVDTQPPAAITDLAITEVTRQNLRLSWTAPEDQGPEGKAASYNLRFSRLPLTEESWNEATPVGSLPAPASPGTPQVFTVTGLEAGTRYYFALKSTDRVGNVSRLSNVASESTLPATLAFGFRLQGINTSGIRKLVEVTLQGASAKTYSEVSFQSGAGGVFTPTEPLSLVDFFVPPSGVRVNVLVKAPGYLRKNLGSLLLNPTDNIASSAWNSLVLKAGDFNHDNLLDMTDIGSLLAAYTALAVPVTSANQVYDLDNNSLININDVALVLTNYTVLSIQGD